MNILDQIVEHKRKEIKQRRELFPVRLLEERVYFESPTVSLRNSLIAKGAEGIIAEFKRKSPSKGIINEQVSVEQITQGYSKAGASALSVLTDENFFGGSDADLIEARKKNSCPILRKDFVLHDYQLLEAKSIGADAILLIAAILTPDKVKSLASFAHTLGLEVLLEVHSKEELMENLEASVDLIGVNNRNLKNFEVSTETSKRLSPLIPKSVVKISESGIHSPADVVELRQSGFRGFLIGQKFMETPDPGKACADFINELRKTK